MKKQEPRKSDVAAADQLRPVTHVVVSSASVRMETYGDLSVRNPAPDASAPSTPTGTFHMVSITAAIRT